jgi:hypothetical protein
MSPPEVWGPAVWTLFHTLSERIHDKAYNILGEQLFNFFVRICKFLPCPECSNDASSFLAKIKFSNMKTKDEFKNTFYLFHNWVNAKKRKPLFNYSNLQIYKNYKLISVFNNFIVNYTTNGNMKLLTESFQRKLIISDFKKWFINSINGFLQKNNIPQQLQNISDNTVFIKEEIISKENISKEQIEIKPVSIEENVSIQ